MNMVCLSIYFFSSSQQGFVVFSVQVLYIFVKFIPKYFIFFYATVNGILKTKYVK